jgi:hypothetical protein
MGAVEMSSDDRSMTVIGVRRLCTAHTPERTWGQVLISTRVGKILYQSFRERNWSEERICMQIP